MVPVVASGKALAIPVAHDVDHVVEPVVELLLRAALLPVVVVPVAHPVPGCDGRHDQARYDPEHDQQLLHGVPPPGSKTSSCGGVLWPRRRLTTPTYHPKSA